MTGPAIKIVFHRSGLFTVGKGKSAQVYKSLDAAFDHARRLLEESGHTVRVVPIEIAGEAYELPPNFEQAE